MAIRAPWGSAGLRVCSSEKAVPFVLGSEQGSRSLGTCPQRPLPGSLGRNPRVQAEKKAASESVDGTPCSVESLYLYQVAWQCREQLPAVGACPPPRDPTGCAGLSQPLVPANVGHTSLKHLSGPEVHRRGGVERSRDSGTPPAASMREPFSVRGAH